MALSDILQKILAEAKKEIAKINDSKSKELLVLEKEYLDKFESKKVEIQEKTVSKKEAIQKRMQSLANMEERNSLLKTKQGIIEEVFAQAYQTICELNDEEYKKVISGLLKQLTVYKSGKIIPAKGRLKITKEALERSKLPLEIDSEGDFSGGLIFKSEELEINNTFANIIFKAIKPELEAKIALKLFK